MIGIAILVIIAACLAVSRIRAIRHAEERLREVAPDIDCVYAELLRIEDFESGYLMRKDWAAFLKDAKAVLKAAKKVPAKTLEKSGFSEKIKHIRKRSEDASFQSARNAEYKAHELELCNELFSNIDGGKSLDPQQRDAIVTDEYSNLVIAGAGSGKTSVVVGKVKYLVERWGIDPADILVTSFTRASVNDLKSRIEGSGVDGVSARTFHSIGLRVLGREYAVADENALRNSVDAYLSKELKNNPKEASAFIEFFGLRILVSLEDPDEEVAEERMKYLKASDMRSLKGLVQETWHQEEMDTIRGERVHSLEELMIANFLFLNGVEYEYEKRYTGEIPEELLEDARRAYQPDFYLSDYDIWLEHFGVAKDKNGKLCVPWMQSPVEEQRYLDGMKWKRQVHAACNTRLIESYSYWNKDHNLLNHLEQLLRENGVELNIDSERNAEICGSLLRDKKFFNSMSQLLCTFISLVKSGNKTTSEVDDAARETYRGNGAMHHRYELFTTFAWPIFKSYQAKLEAAGEIDYDDMINKAAGEIRREGYKESYRYIIVDEYQDISLSRFGLLSAIRDACGAKLMCVGDDWQSIYRFAGSDVTLFTNYGKLVGDYEEMRIEHTYRNSQELVDAASGFILKNPDQLRKTVISQAPSPGHPPIAIVSAQNQQAAFALALNELASLPEGGGEIKVLGRNNHDLERIFPGLEPTGKLSFRKPKRGNPDEEKFTSVIEYRGDGETVTKEIGFMTVHKSKGLQADNIIVIGLLNEQYGFPNMIVDDPIIELLLADSDNYEYAEERRLFYVALTRTKNRVFLITGSKFGHVGASVFIPELYYDGTECSIELFNLDERPASLKCPACGGLLMKKVNGSDGTEFVGCSNYPYCDKTYDDVRVLEDKKKCPECGGWLVRMRRKSDGKEFFGCSNYPNYCGYSMDLDGSNAKVSKTQKAKAYKGPIPDCPECGAPMKYRTGDYGSFFGCSRWPDCTGTRKLSEASTTQSKNTATPKKRASSQIKPAAFKKHDLKTGDYVLHKAFGHGRVTKVEGAHAWVRFDDSQQEKKLTIAFAPMEKRDK